jgi:hypothetical protein
VALAELNAEGVVEDLRVYLGLADGFDLARGQLVVDLALSRVENILSPVPALARAIVLDVARRGYTNPSEVQSETVGPFQRTYGSGAVGVYLTEREEAQLRAIAAGDSASGAFTIRPGGSRCRRAFDAAPGPW